MSAKLYEVRKHEILGQHVREYPGATKCGSDTALKLAVKQYTPRRRRRADARLVTILAAGGNGFPKEMYEPLWDDLLGHSNRRGNSAIKSIWIADMAHQGRSGEINKGRLGSDPSWMDHARDLLTLVNDYRDDMTTPIIGIGHSIGANALINLSTFHPRLLSHLILFEPILAYTTADGTRMDCTREGVYLAPIASKKSDRWPSRPAAKDALSRTRPYIGFDKRVLHCFVEHGLRPTGGSCKGAEEVGLVTSKAQQAVTYIRPLSDSQDNSDQSQNTRQAYRKTYADLDEGSSGLQSFYCPGSSLTYARLPDLRPKVLFIIGGKSAMFSPQKRGDILAQTGSSEIGNGGMQAGSVKEVFLPEQGHLLTFENVSGCAEAIVEYLNSNDHERSEQSTSCIDPAGKSTKRWKEEVERELGRMRRMRERAMI